MLYPAHDLVQDREIGINRSVYYSVKNVARAVPKITLPRLLINLAIPEELNERLNLSRMKGNEIIFTDEDRYLALCGYPGLLAPHRKVKNEKKVFFILIYLGSLYPAEAVI